MWKEMQTLPPDGRQSETALMIARGVRRLLRARGFSSLTELSLTDGRRADIAAVSQDGEVLIVEVKSCAADFRADCKWRDYAACCDRLYFAISEHTPVDLMPLEAGLIVADPYGAEIVREAERAQGAAIVGGARRRPGGYAGILIGERRCLVRIADLRERAEILPQKKRPPRGGPSHRF